MIIVYNNTSIITPGTVPSDQYKFFILFGQLCADYREAPKPAPKEIKNVQVVSLQKENPQGTDRT